MAQDNSPLNRSIGVSGVIRWLIAVLAVLAVGAAFAERHYALGVAGAVFIAGAVILGYRGWRSRQAVDSAAPPSRGA